ncbi:hypothetical protein B0H13DRAFT_1718066 [Mycena leptocephala]|nr:hypothetical protein B0H13DRAFT_1718066 [Mycena leptocephala]
MPLLCVEAIEEIAHTPRKADVIVPITPFSAASAVQGHTGDARLHWQNGPGDGGIYQIDVNGPLTTGIHVATTPIVPGNEALLGTPIATVVNLDSSGTISEIRLYFFSPDHVLSEYIEDSSGVRGGPFCTDCITTLRFGVEPGSTALYALRDNAASGIIRVGFISAGAPTTFSEAVFTTQGGWQLGQLHNA